MKKDDVDLLTEAYFSIYNEQMSPEERDEMRSHLKTQAKDELPGDLGVDSVSPDFEDAMVEFILSMQNLVIMLVTIAGADGDMSSVPSGELSSNLNELKSNWKTLLDSANNNGYDSDDLRELGNNADELERQVNSLISDLDDDQF